MFSPVEAISLHLLMFIIQVSLKPSILLFLTQIMAKLRWEEGSYIPLPRVRVRLGILVSIYSG